MKYYERLHGQCYVIPLEIEIKPTSEWILDGFNYV